jgi:hypothetical protein
MTIRFALLALSVALAACSDDSAPPADASVDAFVIDLARGPDQTPDIAAPGDTVGPGLPTSCSDACATQTLSATFGAVTEPLARGVYGVDRDARGNPGVYIEAHDGGDPGCPEQTSPTPDRTLIISGLPLPVSGTPITEADGLVVSLLDFKGTLITSPLAKATASSVTFTAADVCPACVGQPSPSDADGFVALDLSATFPGGTVSGHVYATHCDSLDL